MKKYLESISIWPAYVPPEKDELFSSWIFRNSSEHKIKPHSFTNYYLNTSSFWARDIDKYIPPNILSLISCQTPMTTKQIEGLLLTSYKDIIYSGEFYSSYSLGVTNLGIYHRTRTQNGLLLCPSCITQNGYYRKSWRLTTSVGCSNCNVYLIDSCPNCLSPIIFQRLEIGEKNNYKDYPLYFCWKCHFDLRKSNQIKLPNLVKQYQAYIDYSIARGYNRHANYSFLYFDVLYLILRRVQSGSTQWTRIRDAFIKEFGVTSNELFLKSQFPSFNLRSEILPLIYRLLENWPTDFVDFCKKYHLRYSDFTRGEQDIPFWFKRAFKDFF
jgi:hypothetical protein